MLADAADGERTGGDWCGMKRKYAILLTAAWATDFALMLSIFTTGRYLAEREADQRLMGFVGGMFSLMLGLAGLLGGVASDRFGRRRVVTASAVLLVLCAVGSAATLGRFDALYYVCYWLGGAAAGGIYPPIYAWLSEDRGRRPGSGIAGPIILFCLAWNLGMMSGQSVGGWLFALGARWPLYLASGLTMAVIALVQCVGPAGTNTPTPPATASVAADRAAGHLRARAAAFARLAWLANLGSAFAMTMVIHLFPKLAVDALHLPAERHGLFLAAMRVTIIAVYFLMAVTRFWHQRLGAALTCQAGAVAGLILIATTSSPALALLGLLCIAQLGGYNYFASLYYSTGGSADAQRGAASGLHEATLAAGFAGGAFVGGMVGERYGIRSPYLLAAAVIVLLALVQVALYLRSAGPRLTGAPAAPPLCTAPEAPPDIHA